MSPSCQMMQAPEILTHSPLPPLHSHALFHTVSPSRWDVPGGRHPSSDPQSRRASLHPPAGLRRLSWLPDLCFMSGAKGRPFFSFLLTTSAPSTRQPLLFMLLFLKQFAPGDSNWGLINLCVLSWPTCPSPGGTAGLPAGRSFRDTTRTASAPAACFVRPTRSCGCATAEWYTCLVRSLHASSHLHKQHLKLNQ